MKKQIGFRRRGPLCEAARSIQVGATTTRLDGPPAGAISTIEGYNPKILCRLRIPSSISRSLTANGFFQESSAPTVAIGTRATTHNSHGEMCVVFISTRTDGAAKTTSVGYTSLNRSVVVRDGPITTSHPNAAGKLARTHASLAFSVSPRQSSCMPQTPKRRTKYSPLAGRFLLAFAATTRRG